ncbi:hypothetical protein EDD75_0331 [Thermodesulfitimonas autotrophica]|uniref:Uncharacterized protein n=1 Tax=Thermodesulfitimonas autotrophica TaxID=1894989 RepID=A0A3N5BUF3_9THEO|nr:hypothetical protein [Thermodesulfitimonas autotrophica]RPF49515.1 hypothetical protein EDD75_0331 [Thermodesulfitimonas autotrophica]
MSPFSRYYLVESRPVLLREWVPSSPREALVKEIVSSCGAAAGFTLQDLWPNPAKARKKLLALHRAGYLYLHKLRGEREMNVFSLSSTFPLDPGLRQLAVAQLYARLKRARDCRLVPQDPPGYRWLLSYGEKSLQVFTLRKSDDPLLLLPLLKQPAVVVAESFTDAFKGFPVRLVLDEELVSGPLKFYLPDGRVDEEAAVWWGEKICQNFKTTS